MTIIRLDLTKHLAVFALTLLFMAIPVCGQENDNAADDSIAGRIDKLVSESYPTDGTGAAVLVKRGDEVIYRDAIGMADIELGVPLTPEMVFRIGSLTKQFTAAAIMLLVEEGKVSLDSSITDYLPNFPTQGHTVTVRHLLTHTSGIRSYTDKPTWRSRIREDLSTKQLIDMFKDEPFDFAPGTKWHYDNSGYVLLGAIIERVSGFTYAEFLQRRIFGPLGLEHTFYDTASRIVPGRARGYTKGLGDAVLNATYASMTQSYAAGALLSTVDDLARWTEALFGGELISEKSLDEMTTPHTIADGSSTKYGFGLAIIPMGDKRLIAHSGGIFGFTSHALYQPDEGIFITVLCNSDSPQTVPGKLASTILKMLLGRKE